jgi:hypothetical protein
MIRVSTQVGHNTFTKALVKKTVVWMKFAGPCAEVADSKAEAAAGLENDGS